MLTCEVRTALVFAGIVAVSTACGSPSSPPPVPATAPLAEAAARGAPSEPDAARVARQSTAPIQEAHWVPVAKGRLADVLVEQALYEEPGAPHFFVRIRVVNKTARVIGADLRGYFDVYYPNQWGASQATRREAINEMRATPPPLDDAGRAKLLGDLRAGVLATIPVHGSIDYYRDFNASSRADVDGQSRAFQHVIIAMDGWLDLSDGNEVERHLPAQDDSSREVVLDVPVRWAQVPAGATVLADWPHGPVH